jgi:phosphatidate phosphatase APP1
LTTTEGDYDGFVTIETVNGSTLSPGNGTGVGIQQLNGYAQTVNETAGNIPNATYFLVPEEGLTIISDIDDILRVTKIYEPAEGLLNSFARPFTAWDNMPVVYANWSDKLPKTHFQ